MARRGPLRAESLRTPAILALAALILLDCLLALFVIDSGLRQRADARAVRLSQQVVGDLHALQALVTDGESTARGFLLTGDADDAASVDAAPATIDQLAQRLRRMLSRQISDGDQLARLDQVMILIAAKLTDLRQAIELQRNGHTGDALGLLRSSTGLDMADRLRSAIAVIATGEEQRLNRWLDERQRQCDLAAGIAAVGGVFALLMMVAACVLATFFARTNQAVHAALQSARDAAVLADRAKSQFLATASHDLRQPLHAMNLFISALRRRVSGEEAAKLVANMASAAESMQMMFNSLLDVSKLNAGVVEPVVRDFPIDEVFDRLRSAFAASAAAKGLDLEIAPTTISLRTDPVLLESILRNLISNAVRYTRHGEVTVHALAQGETASIEVSDTGPGIPADQIERAFEEFQRLDTSNAAERGLGLGLAIVRRLARLLDLPIEINSSVGIGTSFIVHVPLVPNQALPADSESEVVPSLAGRRVLLVDDDPLVREALAREIADWGARITVVGSADAALWALGSEPPDVAIVDRDLGPGVSGIDLLALLDAHFGRPIPAIVVTGATDPAALDELRRCGAPWLTKPLDAAVLRARVAGLLAEKRVPLPTG